MATRLLSAGLRRAFCSPARAAFTKPHGAECASGNGAVDEMGKSPAFQWYPKDILASARVQELSLAEEGAYRRLLDFCWINGSIPADPERCARLIGKGASIGIANAVQPLFTPDPNDPAKLIHDRLELEREKQKEHSEKRKAAAEARWSKLGKPAEVRGKQAKSRSVKSLPPTAENNAPLVEPVSGSNANAMQMQCFSSSSSSSSSSSIILPSEECAPANVFAEIFGKELSIYQREQLAVVSDLSVWRQTLSDWRLNQYSPKNLAGMIQSYRANVVKPAQNGNGGNRNNGAYVGASTVKSVPFKPLEVTMPSPLPEPEYFRLFKQEIEKRISADSYATWFRPLGLVSQDGAVMTVRVPDDVFESWIVNNYLDTVSEALAAAGIEAQSIVFETAKE